jgi:glycosyltransferase involved in cell wall biosynthesis
MTADAVGGVWTYALDLARGFGAAGIATTLAVMGPPPFEAQREEAGSIANLNIRYKDCKLEWQPDPWADVDFSGDWLLTLERELRPDVVHLNGYAHGSLPFQVPKLVVAHSCVLSWWEAVHGEPAPRDWDEYRRRVTAGLRSVDLVIAPTRAMLDSANRFYGPISHSKVIPNGRTPRLFANRPKEPFVLTAGRLWDQAKNLKALEAIAGDIEWPVYAAGEGDASRQIHALGQLSSRDLREWMARASIFAMPALYEPFGLSVLEAAMSGCALVLGDIPSLRENWNGAALFASPRDPRNLREQTQTLIRDDALRVKFQVAAHERARTFTAERMVTAYLDTYAALLVRSQSATALRS